MGVAFLFGPAASIDFKRPVASTGADFSLLDQLKAVGTAFAQQDVESVRTLLTELYPGTRALDDGRFDSNNPELVVHALTVHTAFEAAANLEADGQLGIEDKEAMQKVFDQFVAKALKSDRKGMWKAFYSVPKKVADEMRKDPPDDQSVEDVVI